MAAIWLGFGLASIILFFTRGLAGAVLRRRFARPAGAGVASPGYAVVALLLPALLLLGAVSFLYALVVAEGRAQCMRCSRPRGLLEAYCLNCERPPAGAARAGQIAAAAA